MKIAIVHNLPAGGQKRALYEQGKRLTKRHTLDLFTLSTANEKFLPLDSVVRNKKVYSYMYPSRFPHTVRSIYKVLPRVYKLMADDINKGGYDLAFVSPCFLTQAPYVLRYLSIPTVYHCAEPKREFYEWIPRVGNRLTYWMTFPFRLPIKSIDRENTRSATKVVSISHFAKKRIDHIYGISSEMNYLGVDGDFFNPTDTKKENFVLTVGDVSLHKGHDFIVRSLARIPIHIRPKLMIVGHGGSEREFIIKLAQKLNVKLEIKKHASDEELCSLYSRASLFLFAARKEPFGLVLLEAASCGLPVIAVNDGAVRELIDTKMGEIVARNEALFAQKIMVWQKKKLSMDTRRSMHKLVGDKWSWDDSVSRLETVFKSVL